MKRRKARCIIVDALLCLSPAGASRAGSSLGGSILFLCETKDAFFFLEKPVGMTNFQGDRGANRLATNNERELVPYFIEDTVPKFAKTVTSLSLQTYSPSNLL